MEKLRSENNLLEIKLIEANKNIYELETENKQLKQNNEELKKLRLLAGGSSSDSEKFENSIYELINDHINNIEHSYFYIIDCIKIDHKLRKNLLSEHEKISKNYFLKQNHFLVSIQLICFNLFE